ncbi:hypothetical protein ES702_05040 [subsurface metagenome]
MNINEFDLLFREKIVGAGVTGSVVRIKIDAVKPGWLRLLTHVTIENEDSIISKCRIGITRAGRDYFLDEIKDCTAAELCVCSSDLLVGEGDFFFADFTGTSTGNSLVLTAIGWDKKL